MTFHYDRLLEEEWNGNNNNRDNADFVETLQDKEGSWVSSQSVRNWVENVCVCVCVRVSRYHSILLPKSNLLT